MKRLTYDDLQFIYDELEHAYAYYYKKYHEYPPNEQFGEEKDLMLDNCEKVREIQSRLLQIMRKSTNANAVLPCECSECRWLDKSSTT